MRGYSSIGDEMYPIGNRQFITGSVYPLLHTEDLPQTSVANELVHPTGLSIKEVQAQKREEWN